MLWPAPECRALPQQLFALPALFSLPPAAFDLVALMRHADACGLPLPRHARFLDTLALARTLGVQRVPSEGFKLGTLYQHFTGRTLVGAHRADADCAATWAVLEGLMAVHPSLPGGDFEARLHALAVHEGPAHTNRWFGWCVAVRARRKWHAAVRQLHPAGMPEVRATPPPSAHPRSLLCTAGRTRLSLSRGGARRRPSRRSAAARSLTAWPGARCPWRRRQQRRRQQRRWSRKRRRRSGPTGRPLTRWPSWRAAPSSAWSSGRRRWRRCRRAGWRCSGTRRCGRGACWPRRWPSSRARPPSSPPISSSASREARLLLLCCKRCLCCQPASSVSRIQTHPSKALPSCSHPPLLCRGLEEAGISTLGQLLEVYPRRLITSQPGRLPEPADADPVATLAVRLVGQPVRAVEEGGWG